jgi:hypothetical protein
MHDAASVTSKACCRSLHSFDINTWHRCSVSHCRHSLACQKTWFLWRRLIDFQNTMTIFATSSCLNQLLRLWTPSYFFPRTILMCFFIAFRHNISSMLPPQSIWVYSWTKFITSGLFLLNNGKSADTDNLHRSVENVKNLEASEEEVVAEKSPIRHTAHLPHLLSRQRQ